MSNPESFAIGRESVRSIKQYESIGSNLCDEFPKKFLTSLPPTFKCLYDTPVNIETDKPWELIEYLGNLLGIEDYPKNKASFWLLDSLALQTLRYKEDLNHYYMGVLINWLTGAIRLLRERRYARVELFKELKDIFIVAATKISEKNQLPYWEEIVFVHDTEEEIEEKKYPSERSLQEPVPTDGIDPLAALEIVMESIYDMYANELRYALIYAVFVEPIEIHAYNLPFFLRTPRQIKLVNPKYVPFDMELHKSLQKIEKAEKSKKPIKKGKKKNDSAPTPPPSLTEERALMCNREFILPLIEANEALEMMGNNSTNL